MRFILYFLLFYFIIKLVRRLIYGPKPKRRFYVNFGTGQAGNPYNTRNSQTDFDQSANEGEPQVGSFNARKQSQSKHTSLQNIQDADFEEIKN